MTDTVSADLASLPLPPKNPLPYRQRASALRSFHSGMDELARRRRAGDPVPAGPGWLMPPIVVATSPQAIRDILSVKDGAVDKTSLILSELRRVLGGNLFNLPYEQWLPRKRTLQPVFTKQHVRQFGGHMAEAAEQVSAGWVDGAVVDLDAECRALDPAGTRPLRSGARPHRSRRRHRRTTAHRVDLRRRSIAAPRAGTPLATHTGAAAGVRRERRIASACRRHPAKCRADPSTDAPLVQALMAATDPVRETACRTARLPTN